MSALASIPSPSSGNLGPFHMYGLMLAIGVIVAIYVGERRWRNRRYPPGGIYDIAFWVVVWGVIGARVYHVITDYQLFEDDPLRALRDLERGVVDLGRGRRRIHRCDRAHEAPPHEHAGRGRLPRGRDRARAGDRAVGQLVQPGAVRQADDAALGARDLPSAPPRTATNSTRLFHPTFLYESIACLAIAGLLLLAERGFSAQARSRSRLHEGQTFALYVALYTFARFFFENLRIDEAHDLGPLRVNAWVSTRDLRSPPSAGSSGSGGTPRCNGCPGTTAEPGEVDALA